MRLVDVREKHVQFGFSGLRECLRGIEVLLHPSHHAEQMAWVRDARRRVPPALRSRIAEFRFYFEPTVETFGFAWLDSPQSIEAELQLLREDESRFVDTVVRRLSGVRLLSPDDMVRLRRPRWYRQAAEKYAGLHPRTAPALDSFVKSPAQSLNSFCDMVAAFYERAIEPVWGPINQRLLDDITMRRRILHENGVAAMLRTLSASVAIQKGRRGVDLELSKTGGEIQFGERGTLLLTPSFFCWPHTQTLFLKSGGAPRCAVTYPLPPLSTQARRLDNAPDLVRSFGALSDPVRIRIVELLRERDLSTRELSGFLKISEPVVSRHLRKLLQCALVTQQRSGYFVMYRLHQHTVKKLAHGLLALT